jgi:hypothetical protein
MKYSFYIILVFMFMIQKIHAGERYHILEFTTSDPKIVERCVDFAKIKKLKVGYVVETVDSLSRCTKLAFFLNKNKYFRAIDLPSIVEYAWTDSSLIETLCESDGTLFASDQMIRPNKVEYLLNGSQIIKVNNYFNGKLVKSNTSLSLLSIDDIFFLMYSGCAKKYNKKYRVKF